MFASELTAIAALPDFCGKINKDVLDLYLIHGYIPAPYSIYEGIYKLEPGKILRLEKPLSGLEDRNLLVNGRNCKKRTGAALYRKQAGSIGRAGTAFDGEHPRSDDGRRAAGSIFVSRNRQLHGRFPDAVDF